MRNRVQVSQSMEVKVLLTVVGRVIVCMALVGSASVTASAQGQKETPPLRPFVSQDSVRVPAPERQERPQLELPEVLVYGRDVSLRLDGRKFDVTPPSPIPRELSRREQVLADTAVLAAREEAPGGQPVGPRSLLLRSRVGSYWTTDVEALFRQARRRLTYGGEMAFRRSDGAVINGHYAMLDLVGRSGYQFSPSGTVRGYLSLSQKGYGLSGATLPDSSRPRKAERHTSAVGIGAELDLRSGAHGQLFASYDFLSLRSSDDTLQAQLSRISGGTHRAALRFSQRLGTTDVSGQASYLREGYSPGSGRDVRNSWAKVEFGASRAVMKKARAYLGLGLEEFSSHQTHKTALIVVGRMAVPLAPEVGLTLQVRRGHDYRQMSDCWEENPYFDPGMQVRPVFTKCALALGAEWRLAKRLVLGAQVSRSWLQNQWYWQRDPATGLFTAGVVPTLALNRAVLTLRGEPSSRLGLDAQFVLCDDFFDLPQLPQDGDVPYLAHRRLAVSIPYRLSERTRVELRSDVMSSRAADMLSQTTLRPFALFGCTVTHRLGRQVSLFLQGENLTNRRYQRWQGYREMGLSILAGGFASW
ncbi:MAG: hypothetical protein ONB06_02235 [candidate division KSB1 bacterium]|nr:hypothetical protein [candidate division KSB1 bacterium]